MKNEYGKTILPRAYNIQALDLLLLDKKANPLGGGLNRKIDFEFDYLGEFQFIFKRALGFKSEVEERVLRQKTYATFFV
jgi:hypothetical protein